MKKTSTYARLSKHLIMPVIRNNYKENHTMNPVPPKAEEFVDTFRNIY